MSAITKQSEEQQKPNAEPEKMSSRDRLLAAYENLNPLTKEEAEMIRKSITEARERSIGEQLRKDIREAKWEGTEDKKPLLPLTGKPGSRERMLAAMAKITPISQETADLINTAIQEAREQSIADTLSA